MHSTHCHPSTQPDSGRRTAHDSQLTDEGLRGQEKSAIGAETLSRRCAGLRSHLELHALAYEPYVVGELR